MCYQVQKGFHSVFVGIPQHHKGYIVYVPHKQRIISLYDVIFDDSFSSVLTYTLQPYLKYMAIRPAVSYIPYTTSSREKTGSIIMFAQSEEGDLLLESCNDIESGNKSDEDSTLASLIS